jgi:hypothetical protein
MIQTHPETTLVLDLSSSTFDLQGRSSCDHPRTFGIFTQNDGFYAFCGLCWLSKVWEDEIPRRVHAYKQLAENGNPELHATFRKHLEVAVGLRPPEPHQPLREYRLARKQYSVPPRKGSYPVSAALWDIMGKQPIIARCMIRSMLGQDFLQIAEDLDITPYGAYQATAKGIRMVLRHIRN